jgi:GDPmannose 4,6-dehydratase
MKTALILGVSGQDGAFLSRFLLQKGYRVVGTSRKPQDHKHDTLTRLGIQDRVRVIPHPVGSANAFQSVIAAQKPDEIYNLAGQSSVARSFDLPEETFESIAGATRYLLTAVRDSAGPVKIFNAGSGDCFGDLGGKPARETDPLNPLSPYGEARADAFMQVQTFRRTQNLFACTGILFNHESFLRPDTFVTMKIVKTACAIAENRCDKLVLGDISIRRDWGWAPEYVEAMWQMLQQETPEDYIIATGTTLRLADFAAAVFSCLGLDPDVCIRTDSRFFRPRDIAIMAADPSRACRDLGWKARYTGLDVARMMVAAEQNRTGPDDI